jgi:pimeloyl-ACP methyl ester carboxylesterase
VTYLTKDMTIERHGSNGPFLLWLHGLYGPGPDAAAIAELARDHRVLVPTLPGFDDAARPDHVDDVSDLALLGVNALDDEGVEDVTVVGHCFGGWVAAEMAVWRPARIARLVLIDALGIRVGGPLDRDIADLFVIGPQERRDLLFADPDNAGPLPADLDEERLLNLMRSEEAAAVYGWEPYLCNPKLRGRLATVSIPSDVIWGAEDRLVGPAYGQAYADALPAGRFHLVAGAGHYPHVERQAAVVELIRAAVQAPPGGHPDSAGAAR